MERIVSATEARVHFGEMMRRAVEDREHIIVQRSGKSYIVLLSYAEYQRLGKGQQHATWRETLDEIRRVRDQIAARLEGRSLTPPEEVLRQLREERDAQLTGLR